MQALTCSHSSLTEVMLLLMQTLTCSHSSLTAVMLLLMKALTCSHLFTQLFDSSDVAIDAGQVEWRLPVVVLLSWIEARVDQQSHQL